MTLAEVCAEAAERDARGEVVGARRSLQVGERDPAVGADREVAGDLDDCRLRGRVQRPRRRELIRAGRELGEPETLAAAGVLAWPGHDEVAEHREGQQRAAVGVVGLAFVHAADLVPGTAGPLDMDVQLLPVREGRGDRTVGGRREARVVATGPIEPQRRVDGDAGPAVGLGDADARRVARAPALLDGHDPAPWRQAGIAVDEIVAADRDGCLPSAGERAVGSGRGGRACRQGEHQDGGEREEASHPRQHRHPRAAA